MDFRLVCSLQHIAFVEISAALYNQNDVKRLIYGILNLHGNPGERTGWSTIGNMLEENMQSLPMPNLLKSNLLEFITDMGNRTQLWLNSPLNRRNFVRNHEGRIYWTNRGTVNARRMTEMILEDESLPVVQRYKLACCYCLESFVSALWKNLHELGLHSAMLEETRADVNYMVSIWNMLLNNKSRAICGPLNEKALFRCGFEVSSCKGNEFGSRFFYYKLLLDTGHDTLQKILMDTAVNVAICYSRMQSTDYSRIYLIDVLRFLLSVMDLEVQKKFIDSRTNDLPLRMALFPWRVLLISNR